MRRCDVRKALLLVFALAAPASAYVRTKSHGGTDLYWGKSCVYVTSAAEGSADLPGNTEFEIVPTVLAEWQQKTSACSYLQFKYDVEKAGNREVGYDGINVLKFRESRWCRPATSTMPEKCYSPAAVGITTVFFVDDIDRSDDGLILDADMEYNDVNFKLTDQSGMSDDTTSSPHSDFANTLAHEFGHFVGLDHTCNDMPGTIRFDGDGQRVPACGASDVPQVAKDATMYAFQEEGETLKRSVESDDVNGVCNAYPKARDPKDCSRTSTESGGGCQIGPLGLATGPVSSRQTLAQIALATLLLLAIRVQLRKGREKRAKLLPVRVTRRKQRQK